MRGSDYLFRNMLIAGNHAERKGGAIYLKKGEPDFVNLTIADNRANNDAPSIYAENHGGGVFYNCIIWGNNNGHGGVTTFGGDDLEFYYSDVETTPGEVIEGVGNINVNPFIITLTASTTMYAMEVGRWMLECRTILKRRNM